MPKKASAWLPGCSSHLYSSGRKERLSAASRQERGRMLGGYNNLGNAVRCCTLLHDCSRINRGLGGSIQAVRTGRWAKRLGCPVAAMPQPAAAGRKQRLPAAGRRRRPCGPPTAALPRGGHPTRCRPPPAGCQASAPRCCRHRHRRHSAAAARRRAPCAAPTAPAGPPGAQCRPRFPRCSGAGSTRETRPPAAAAAAARQPEVSGQGAGGASQGAVLAWRDQNTASPAPAIRLD